MIQLRFNRGVLATAAILAGSAVLRPTQAQADPMAVCRADSAAWATAAPTGDPAKVAALFTPEAVWVAPAGTFQGQGEISRFTASWLKPGATIRGTPMAARQVADVVLCSGEYVLTAATAPAEPAKDVKGRYGQALTKTGGGWASEQLTTFPLPPEAQSHAQMR